MSRLPSSRGSSAAGSRGRGAAAAPGKGGKAAARRPGVLVTSPKSDIYVAMLGIALGAILLASLLMILLLNQYGFSVKVSSRDARPAGPVARRAGTVLASSDVPAPKVLGGTRSLKLAV